MAGVAVDLEVDEAGGDHLAKAGHHLLIRSLRWLAPTDPGDELAFDQHRVRTSGAMQHAAQQGPHSAEAPCARPAASTILRSPAAPSSSSRASSAPTPRRSMTIAVLGLPAAAARAAAASSAETPPSIATTSAARARSLSLAATTPTIRPRWVYASRVKTAVLSMLSTSFWTVPALRRVEPAITSGPVSTSIAMSTAAPRGDPGWHVIATWSAPSLAERSSAPRT